MTEPARGGLSSLIPDSWRRLPPELINQLMKGLGSVSPFGDAQPMATPTPQVPSPFSPPPLDSTMREGVSPAPSPTPSPMPPPPGGMVGPHLGPERSAIPSMGPDPTMSTLPSPALDQPVPQPPGQPFSIAGQRGPAPEPTPPPAFGVGGGQPIPGSAEEVIAEGNKDPTNRWAPPDQIPEGWAAALYDDGTGGGLPDVQMRDGMTLVRIVPDGSAPAESPGVTSPFDSGQASGTPSPFSGPTGSFKDLMAQTAPMGPPAPGPKLPSKPGIPGGQTEVGLLSAMLGDSDSELNPISRFMNSLLSGDPEGSRGRRKLKDIKGPVPVSEMEGSREWAQREPIGPSPTEEPDLAYRGGPIEDEPPRRRGGRGRRGERGLEYRGGPIEDDGTFTEAAEGEGMFTPVPGEQQYEEMPPDQLRGLEQRAVLERGFGSPGRTSLSPPSAALRGLARKSPFDTSRDEDPYLSEESLQRRMKDERRHWIDSSMLAFGAGMLGGEDLQGGLGAGLAGLIGPRAEYQQKEQGLPLQYEEARFSRNRERLEDRREAAKLGISEDELAVLMDQNQRAQEVHDTAEPVRAREARNSEIEGLDDQLQKAEIAMRNGDVDEARSRIAEASVRSRMLIQSTKSGIDVNTAQIGDLNARAAGTGYYDPTSSGNDQYGPTRPSRLAYQQYLRKLVEEAEIPSQAHPYGVMMWEAAGLANGMEENMANQVLPPHSSDAAMIRQLLDTNVPLDDVLARYGKDIEKIPELAEMMAYYQERVAANLGAKR